MNIKVLKSDCIRWDIKTEEGQEIVLDLQLYSVSDEQKGRIEEAARTFYNSATEILKSSATL